MPQVPETFIDFVLSWKEQETLEPGVVDHSAHSFTDVILQRPYMMQNLNHPAFICYSLLLLSKYLTNTLKYIIILPSVKETRHVAFQTCL